MTKYRVLFDGDEWDEIAFDSYDEAESYARQSISEWHEGGEILEMSNPGDYPYDPDDEPEVEIIEVDE